MYKFVTPILCSLFASGCITTYDQALEELQYANPHDLCYAATDNRLLRKGEKRAANEILQKKGIECNWLAYGQMHEARRASAINDLRVSQQMQQNSQPRPAFQNQPAPFHSYRINGRMYNCSTIGNMTNCY